MIGLQIVYKKREVFLEGHLKGDLVDMCMNRLASQRQTNFTMVLGFRTQFLIIQIKKDTRFKKYFAALTACHVQHSLHYRLQ